MSYSFSPNEADGRVFGTFGLQYDISEFTRTRDDGYSVMGFVPDCRVFVYGVELTRDVASVSVTNTIGKNSCDIELLNPRGKYEITKQDLMGKWREDKDILSTYDNKQLQRVSPRMFENFMDKLTSNALGSKTANDIKSGLNIAKNAGKLFGNPFGVPEVKGATRQIFETKHFSGRRKFSGDVVFDYKDPVQVFFKGRFSPMWYFGFSGIVTGWDDVDAYGQNQTIKLKCEDILAIWKRSKLTTQAAMYPFSRGQNRMRGNQAKSAFVLQSDLAAAFSFSDLIKLAVYSFDYSHFAYNCHISHPGRYSTYKGDLYFEGVTATNLANEGIYKEAKNKLHDEALIDKIYGVMGKNDGRYMFTGDNSSFGIGVSGGASFANPNNQTSGSSSFDKHKGSTKKKSRGLIDIGKIRYIHKELLHTNGKYALNTSPFGPSVSIYTQYNEIEFPRGVSFTGKNLQAFLDLSVRYWEAEHRIDDNFDPKRDVGTGWKDNSAFGICGTHPALTYEFINNFGILGNIWEQCYKAISSGNTKKLDNLVMSPNDKIMALTGGEPTELIDSHDANKKSPIGTAFNFFRPRLFLILPRRFSDRMKKAGSGEFAQLTNLFKEKKTTVYKFLSEKLKSVEYILYSSPAGDIFMEPELYDFHPLEFAHKLEKKSIVQKKFPILFRTPSGSSEESKATVQSAYMINPHVDHPFFIMNRDQSRVSQTFDHKLIKTVVTVIGGQTKSGGVLDVVKGTLLNATTALSMGGQKRGLKPSETFSYGKYIADGFQKYFDPNSDTVAAYEKQKNLKETFNKIVFYELWKKYRFATILTITKTYINELKNMMPTERTYAIFEDQIKELNNTLDKKGKDKKYKKYSDELYVLKYLFNDLYRYRKTQLATLISKFRLDNSSESSKDAKKKKQKGVIGKSLGLDFRDFDKLMKALDKTNISSRTSTDYSIASILKLGAPYVSISSDAGVAISDAYLKAIDDYKQRGGDKINAHSLADEKALAAKGIYDPRLDMVRLYGYNPGNELSNPYIKNGLEAYTYARTVFNRLKGKAYTISVDLIGRPEFMLNRPYYIERKDAIGLLTRFTISYSYGDAFKSNAKLEYVRKNSITYDYSLGKLDPIVGSRKNAFFKRQADAYYKWNKLQASAIDGTTSAIQSSIAGKSPGFGRALGAKMAGGVAGKVLNSVLPLGGIFIAHDRIGHIPFDTRFGEETKPATSGTKSGGSGNKHIELSPLEESMYDLAKKIKAAAENITDAQETRDTLESDIEDAEKKLEDAKEKFDSAQRDRNSATTTKEIRAAQKKMRPLYATIKKEESIVSAKKINLQQVEALLQTRLNQLFGKRYKSLNDVTSAEINSIIHQAYDTNSGKSDAKMSRTEADIISRSLLYKLFVATIKSNLTIYSSSLEIDLSGNNQREFGGEAVDFPIKLKKESTGTPSAGSLTSAGSLPIA